jgi:transcriptional regulator with XRE-family HTH domain
MSAARKLLSANIKAERKKLGITQEKLAEIAGLSAQMVHDIEGCRTWVSDKTLQKLSDVLGVDIFQLLLPPPNETLAELNAFLPHLPQQIKKLWQNTKDDIDRQLDDLLRRFPRGSKT